MKLSGWTVLVFALIVLLGGIIGYINAGSVISLVVGVVFAALLSVAAFIMFNGKSWGWTVAFGTTAVLGAFFLYRFLLTFKIMPPGMMCLLSAIVLGIMIYQRLSHNKQAAP